MAESELLVLFGLAGRVFEKGHLVLDTVMLFCSTMGLQNDLITETSGAVIHTTHLKGMVKDGGIGLSDDQKMEEVSDRILEICHRIVRSIFDKLLKNMVGTRRLELLTSTVSKIATKFLTSGCGPTVGDRP